MQQATPPSEPVGTRAPKACVPCAVAKVKCETDVGHITCKRCQRLRKTCRAQAAGAQKRKLNSKSDVARLEQKLDGVAAILAASDGLGPRRGWSGPQPLSPIGLYFDELVKSQDEAHLMMNVFRTELTRHCPYVVISPWLTVSELRETKPFLLLVVLMMACRHDIPRQGAMAMAIREIISQRMMVKNEQSLDMLQGMLLYLAWYSILARYHTHLHLGLQLTNLVHLIMAMMIDLGLNKYTTSRKHAKPQREYFRMDGRDSLPPRTMEERRTFLGCFYLTNVISMTARDFEPVRYTKYADDCCRAVSEVAEYPTDAYLVQISRLLYMADKITRTLYPQDFDPASNIAAPIGASVKSLETELHGLKPLESTETVENALLLLHYHAVETHLCEIALDEKIPGSRYGSFPVTRLSLLFACLESTKAFFEVFYSLPASEYFDLPYSTWTLISHLYVVLSKISLISVDGWDQDHVSATLNFNTVMDTLLLKIQEAIASVSGPLQETDASKNVLPRSIPLIFTTVETKIREIKAVHDARKADQSRRAQPTNVLTEQTQPGDQVFTLPDDFTFSDALDFFDIVDEPIWTQSWT